MEYKVCFMFGHATTSCDALPRMLEAAQRHYLKYDIRIFVVGNRGAFDQLAAAAIKQLKQSYRDISLQCLLAYHPAERPVDLMDGFDGSFYPALEGVPRRLSIVKANQYMIDHADSTICYANGIGNSRNLLEYAQRRIQVPIDNIA